MELVKLLYDKDILEQEVVKMRFDVKKVPPRGITSRRLKDGYLLLGEIKNIIGRPHTQEELLKAYDRFYKR